MGGSYTLRVAAMGRSYTLRVAAMGRSYDATEFFFE